MAPKLRVTHVVRSDAFAGVERYICGAATELAARGHEVCVIGGATSRMRQELGGSVSHVPAARIYLVARALVGDGGSRDIVHVHMTAAELAALAASPLSPASIVSTRHFPD